MNTTTEILSSSVLGDLLNKGGNNDSALSDTEWPTLNSVTTKRKAGRPSVSQKKGKKGGKKAVLVWIRKMCHLTIVHQQKS